MCSCNHSLLMTGVTNTQVNSCKSGTKFKIKRLKEYHAKLYWTSFDRFKILECIDLMCYWLYMMWMNLSDHRLDLIWSSRLDVTIGSSWSDRVVLMWHHRLNLVWSSWLDVTIGLIWSDRVDLKLIEFWRRYNFITTVQNDHELV